MGFDAAAKQLLAVRMRENPTQSEAILRDALIAKGYKFKFQYVLHGYIPDFYFPKAKKIVELDGKWCHDKERDKKRDADFLKHGIQTHRVRSCRVFTELPKVLRMIGHFLNDTSPPPKIKNGKIQKAKKKPSWGQIVPRVKEMNGLRRMKK